MTAAGTAMPGVSEDAFLGGRLVLHQPARGYRAGVDAVLLAAAVPAPSGRPTRVLDAGCGVGTVGLCVTRRLGEAQAVLLEREPSFADLAALNIAANHLGDRVTLVRADIGASAAEHEALGIAPHSFDIVLANPPFHETANGTPASDRARAGAHAMPTGGLDRWARFMARTVKSGGTAILIHKAEALAEVLGAMTPRFGALRVLPVLPRPGEPAIRILVQGIRGSRARLTLVAPFTLHGPDGHGFTPEAEAILRDGGSLTL